MIIVKFWYTEIEGTGNIVRDIREFELFKSAATWTKAKLSKKKKLNCFTSLTSKNYY